eukprot:gene30714-35742_t
MTIQVFNASGAEPNGGDHKDNAEEEQDATVHFSPECAAVLLLVSTGIGGGVAMTVMPMAGLGMCAASGFCAVGPTAGSFAAWWQSTMLGGASAGSLFSILQSIAMKKVGVSTTVVIGGMLGGSVGAGYINNFCGYIDEVDPKTKTGVFIQLATAGVEKTAQGVVYLGKQYSKHVQPRVARAYDGLLSGWKSVKEGYVDFLERVEASIAAEIEAEHRRKADEL